MNSHAFCRCKEPDCKAVLHQRLAATQREATSHDFQAPTIFLQLLNSAFQRHRHAIAQIPGVRVVAIETPELTPGSPGNDAHSGSIHRGPGREGMKKADISGVERLLDRRLR